MMKKTIIAYLAGYLFSILLGFMMYGSTKEAAIPSGFYSVVACLILLYRAIEQDTKG